MDILLWENRKSGESDIGRRMRAVVGNRFFGEMDSVFHTIDLRLTKRRMVLRLREAKAEERSALANRERIGMNRRRLVWFQLGTLLCFAALLIRLGWVQLVGVHPAGLGNRTVMTASVGQRGQGIVLDSGRGHFLDRNRVPLTGDPYLTLVVFPHGAEASAAEPDKLRRLAALLGTTEAEWRRWAGSLEAPAYWPDGGDSLPIRLTQGEADAVAGLGLAGIVVAPYLNRYLPDAPAAQLIGYIGENPALLAERYAEELAAGAMGPARKLGVAGLERTFDAYLQQGEPTTLAVWTDGRRRPRAQEPLRLIRPDNPFLPLDIVTTLDLGMQRALESILDRHQVGTGAAVILDARSGDIVAMSSRPKFRPVDVHPERPDWANRALKAAAPGSVFKLVVAAAALEYGVVGPDERFFCPGEWDKYGLSCWKRDGHGHVTLGEAFAGSCNVAFAQLSERLTAEQIADTARRLGLGLTVGWEGEIDGARFRQLDGEEPGRIFADPPTAVDGGAKAQAAIGQRDVRITPLQAANMALAVVNRGRVVRPRAVSAVRYRNGIALQRFAPRLPHEDAAGISPATAATLRQWMRDVVATGTGRGLNGGGWALAGKSGTAQVPLSDGEGENEWFVGYGPADDPRYVAAVMIAKPAADAEHAAIPLFGAIMAMLQADPS
jgi:cell division protein FtsI/penicillin-binding protein 2